MYQRGKPFVGAKVIISSGAVIHYYIVKQVSETSYVWWSSITENTYLSANETFLQKGEEPFYKTTDYLKALKKCLK